jgi:hypothetical protein
LQDVVAARESDEPAATHYAVQLLGFGDRPHQVTLTSS